MKSITIIFIVLLLIILIATVFKSFSININLNNKTNSNSVSSSSSSVNSKLESKDNNEGPVSITVTPQVLSESLSTLNFDITLNTHSVDLNYDLTALSEIVDDKGRSYKPIAWDGDKPGGHHRRGVLKFEPISPLPKSVELKIKSMGGIPERSFKWTF